MKIGIFIVAAIYIIIVLLMMPLREVGYHQDFGYHHAVRDFLQTGILKMPEVSVTSFLFQGLLGALFSLFLGFSYKTLHISVIVLFFFGIIAFYKSLKELNVGEVKSIVFTISLLVFPFLLRFIFTFMSNIPHLALELISLYFGILALKRKSWPYALSSSIIGMLAFLVRNFGLVLPVSLFIAFAAKSYYDRKF